MPAPVCPNCHHRPSGRYEGAYAARCCCQCHDVADAGPELLAACKSLIQAANDALDHWDADRDSKVGKLLSAMSGHTKGYRADLDAAFAAIARAEGKEPTDAR